MHAKWRGKKIWICKSFILLCLCWCNNWLSERLAGLFSISLSTSFVVKPEQKNENKINNIQINCSCNITEKKPKEWYLRLLIYIQGNDGLHHPDDHENFKKKIILYFIFSWIFSIDELNLITKLAIFFWLGQNI